MPTISDESERDIPYPLNHPLVVDGDTPNDGVPPLTLDWPTTDNDEKIVISLELSLNEYVALASGVDVGRDIAYGIDTNWLWWIWVRSVNVVEFCERVMDCIDSDAEVQAAMLNQIMNNPAFRQGLAQQITNILNNNVGFNPDETTVTADTAAEVKPLDNCNLDALWAGIRDGIVQRLDDNARQFLETLNSMNDVAQRAENLLKAIPLIGTLAEGLAEQFTETIPDMLNLFESYSSIENMDTIACSIFELVCAECRYPTLAELFSEYASLGVDDFDDLAAMTLTTAVGLLSGLVGVPAIAFYHTMIAFSLLILYFDDKIMSLNGVENIAELAALGEDFENDNWEQLCDGCLTDDYMYLDWDFQADGPGEWSVDVISPSQGEFVAGQGWKGTLVSGFKSIKVSRLFDATWRVRAVGYFWEISGTPTSNTNRMEFRPNVNITTGTFQQTNLNTCSDTNYNRTATGVSLQGYNQIVILGSIQPTSLDVYLRRVRLVFLREYAPSNGYLEATQDFCP